MVTTAIARGVIVIVRAGTLTERDAFQVGCNCHRRDFLDVVCQFQKGHLR